jgi:hypothetical protein
MQEVGSTGDNDWNLAINGNVLTYTVTPLTPKERYRFRVRAKGESGVVGEYSYLSGQYASPVPAQPTIDTSATESTKSSILLTWNKPDFDGANELPILGYIIYALTPNDSKFQAIQVVSGRTNTYQIITTGVSAGLRYGLKGMQII